MLISVANRDKQAALKVAKAFHELGFRIRATRGTHQFLSENGIPGEPINKQTEGWPNIVDGIMNKEIHLVINTPAGKESKTDDSYLRKTAIKYRRPLHHDAPGRAGRRAGHCRSKPAANLYALAAGISPGYRVNALRLATARSSAPR